MAAPDPPSATEYEDEHVHQVYEQIASHFSQTRYKVGIQSGRGRALIFAWALEQKSSRRGWDRGDDQDVLVPWVFKPQQEPRHKRRQQHDQQFQQEHQQHHQPQHVSHSQLHHAGHGHDLPRHPQLGLPQPALDADCDYAHQFQRTFQRYYHLYVQGELQSEVAEAGGTVVDAGYDRDNWWVISSVESNKVK
ncbi:hypothetical protein DV736_g1050, partial [Chaetothyriales sp. CBS 134916]